MIDEALKRILPQGFVEVIEKKLNSDRLYEIRLRNEKPVMINYGGSFYFLGPDGLKDSIDGCYICKKGFINDIVIKASEYSLYAVNDQICNGFLTLRGGIRLGIAGEVVNNNGSIKTIKNFYSLNVRIPHEVKDCAKKVYELTCKNSLKNTLIISPPGAGKTTLLRDLSRLLGNALQMYNVLLVDERNELAANYDGISQLDVGVSTDIISNCSKEYAFSQAVRALRPDVIICDELSGSADVAAIEYACSCGVNVFASVHARDHIDLINKPGFDNIIKKRMFSRFAVLSSRHGPGTLDGVFDENFDCLYS